jgi:uncharacterized protein
VYNVLVLSTNVRKSSTTTPSSDIQDRLGVALFGKTRRWVLGWLFTHPDEAFYVRELVKLTGAAQGAISRELHELAQAGIIRRTVRGREVFYQVDEACPIFPELKSIFLKTAGLASEIRAALGPLARNIDVAFLFGSASTGDLRRQSDVDLIAIGVVSFGDIVERLGRAQQQLGREINPVVYSREEFGKKLGSGHHFLTTILREPHLFVVGGPRELERLASVSMGHSTSNERARDRRPARRRGARPGG